MKENVKQIIKNAIEENAIKFKEATSNVLYQKIGDRLQQEYKNVASNLFKKRINEAAEPTMGFAVASTPPNAVPGSPAPGSPMGPPSPAPGNPPADPKPGDIWVDKEGNQWKWTGKGWEKVEPRKPVSPRPPRPGRRKPGGAGFGTPG